jgi:hypothetical protein
VANEFFDVFFEELPGTIKFVIEIVYILLLCMRDPIEWLLSK